MKILFVLRKSQKAPSYSHGSFGLSNSARFVVNRLRTLGHEVSAVQVADANVIDKEVTQFNPDVVVLEALWVTPTKLAELLSRHLRRKWIVRIHSKAAFLAMEGIAMEWITGYNHVNDIYGNVVISCNNAEFNSDINKAIGLDSVYLPNIYHPESPPFHRHNEDDGLRPIHIGCFGAIRPLKNQFQQAIAAVLFAQKIKRTIHFHINGTRKEQLGENVSRNIRVLLNSTPHKLIEHDWYSHSEFLNELVPQMDLGMQISFTESFNIVTADFVYAGVPIVVSNDVDWMPHFCRVDPNETNAIVHKLEIMWKSRTPFHNVLAKRALDKYNMVSTEIWKKELENLWEK